jgi:hypothetical protein
MPFWDECKWTILIGDESLFDQYFGAFVPPLNRNKCIRLDSNDNPTDQCNGALEPWQIARAIVERFPRNFNKHEPRPTEYTRWYESLIAYLAIYPGAVPSVSADGKYKTVWINYLSTDVSAPLRPVTEFPSPPGGTYGANLVKDPEIAIAQPRPLDAPCLIWPTTRSSDSRLDNWYEDNARGDPREVQ